MHTTTFCLRVLGWCSYFACEWDGISFRPIGWHHFSSWGGSFVIAIFQTSAPFSIGLLGQDGNIYWPSIHLWTVALALIDYLFFCHCVLAPIGVGWKGHVRGITPRPSDVLVTTENDFPLNKRVIARASEDRDAFLIGRHQRRKRGWKIHSWSLRLTQKQKWLCLGQHIYCPEEPSLQKE